MIRIVDRDGVRTITLDRPDALNACSLELYRAFAQALHDAREDDDINVVVLTGEGRAFCAGTDIKEMAQIFDGTAPEGVEDGFPTLMAEVVEFDKPLVAAVNGLGIGLGLTILAYCDQVFMAESARLKAPFVELGVPAEAGSTFLLPARIGWQNAARVLLTGDWINASEAVELGLASQVSADGAVLDDALAFATRVAAGNPASTRAIKHLLVAAQADAVRAAREREDEAFAAIFRPGP